MTTIIAIDPGANGAIAYTDNDGFAHVEKMPEGMTEIADFLITLKNKSWTSIKQPLAVVEKVGGYMPGNSGPAAVKFARHCGNIEAILYCLGIPTEEVTPHKWMKSLGIMPKDKAERKRKIKEIMARTYPALKVTLVNADALGILTWKLRGGK